MATIYWGLSLYVKISLEDNNDDDDHDDDDYHR